MDKIQQYSAAEMERMMKLQDVLLKAMAKKIWHSKLEKIELGWVNFQLLRRTQASLRHKEGVDPKAAADQ